MKKLLHSGLTLVVLAFLTTPAWAEKGGHSHGSPAAASHSKGASHSVGHKRMSSKRSNKRGDVHGLERAEEVQAMNTKADANRGFTVAPGVEKAEGETTAKPGTSGKSKGKANKGGPGDDKDQDESKD